AALGVGGTAPAAGCGGAGGGSLLISNWRAAVQQLQGRFQFLQGIYRAHSKAEDEIVFPALEAKHVRRAAL
ncbi:MAG: hypothetical protein ACKO57_07925, partial [Alphaproteobacteria bacterium]